MVLRYHPTPPNTSISLMKPLAPVLWISALILLGVSCAPPPVLRQDWRREQGFEALLRLSAEKLRQLEDLTAEAGIAMRQAGGRQRGTALIQLKNPDLFRVEVRGPLYSHVFTALLQEDSLMVHGPAVGGDWKGTVQGPLLVHLTGMDLGVYDLRYALLGVVAPGSVDSSRALEYPRGDRVIVPLRGKEVLRRVWIDLYRGLVTREDIELPGGHLLLSRRLRDYQKVGDLYLPGRVEIRQEDVALTLEYRHYAIDRGIPEERFFQGIPLDRMQRVD